jgi:hypothetical protein
MEKTMKPGERKVSGYILRSGQPQAYADTECVAIIEFAFIPYAGPLEWKQELVNEERVRAIAPHLMLGFTNKKRNEGDWWDTYLDYLRPLEADDKGFASAWEFRTVTCYTD